MNASFPFDRQKATESASEFIRLAGGRLNILKLVKLMYLLDRESLKKRGVPVVGGEYFSMKDGPVTSEVLDSINHKCGEGSGLWDTIISERENHEVGLRRHFELEHLSPYEKNVIHVLHEEHKTKDQYQLRDWCHDNCKEWHKPNIFFKRKPIEFETMASEIARTSAELVEAQAEAKFMQEIFAMA